MKLHKWWNESSKEPGWIFNKRIVTKWVFVIMERHHIHHSHFVREGEVYT
jgi:hypothetical protein